MQTTTMVKKIFIVTISALTLFILSAGLSRQVQEVHAIECLEGYIQVDDFNCVGENNYDLYCRIVYPAGTERDGCVESGRNLYLSCRNDALSMKGCTGQGSVVQQLIDFYSPSSDNPCSAYPFGTAGWTACVTGQDNNLNNATTHICGKGDNAVPVSIDVECTGEENPILAYAGGVINFLSVGVGVVVVAMIVTGGVQYITSRGVPQQIEAAKKRITNALIALIMFIFLYVFLQWLIPGGGLFG